MRINFAALVGLTFLAAASAADAKVAITVDKDNQQMTVAVDGVTKYRWPVSTGNPSHETPNGSFQTFRMEEDHYSKEFDDAPMPHAIFFTKVGHAIHGTDSVSRLGSPASHGCVRLSRANASTLWDLVKAEGVLNTTVTLTGSSQVALARNPRGRATAVARGDAQQLDAVGNPVVLTPRGQRTVDDYSYVDGSADGQTYAAPRGYRRTYDAQANPQYYGNDGYVAQGYQQGYAPQGYAPQVYAPRPYYQPRGYYQ